MWAMLIRKLTIGRGRFKRRYVPVTAALVLTAFAPSVAASNPQTVTPTTRALTLTTYAPTVTGPSPELVVPGTATLTLTEFAPTVTFTLHRLVTPTTRALVLTTYIPVVGGDTAVVVPTASLTTARFAPTITAPAPQTVTPTTRALTLTTYAPAVTSPNHLVVTPTTRALVTARFAPTISTTGHQRVTPPTRALSLTRYSAVVSTATSGGAFFYISPTGSDTNTGTIGSPWRNIQKFVAQSSAGDTLYCRGGSYSAQTDVSTTGHSGASGNPITIRNYPGETPVFTSIAFYLEGGSSYWVLDGITINGPIVGSSSHIWIGNGRSTPGATDTHHMTIRNCSITKTGGAVTAHGIYLSHRVADVTIEDNTIVGVSSSLPQDRCGAIHIYHAPTATRTLIQRNILRRWPKGVILWDEAGETGTPLATATILHNTFQNLDFHLDTRYHAAITVRDNVGDNSISFDLYDPFDSAATTADHNYWSQTLTPSGGLTAGSPAINGALDGSDAGAVPYP